MHLIFPVSGNSQVPATAIHSICPAISCCFFTTSMLPSSIVVLHLGWSNSMQQHKEVQAVAHQLDSSFAGKDWGFLRTASWTLVNSMSTQQKSQPNTGRYQQEYSQHLEAINDSLLFGTYETTAGHCVQYWATLLQDDRHSKQVQWRAMKIRGLECTR